MPGNDRLVVACGSKRPLVLVSVVVSVAGLMTVLRGSPPETDLRDAVRRGDLGSVRRAILWGVDVDRRDAFGVTPLHEAAIRGNVPIASMLMEAGAQVDATAPCTVTAISTPEAFFNGTVGAGAFSERRFPPHCETPLHCAILMGHEDVVRLLLAHGADPQARAWEGGLAELATPMALAKHAGHGRISRLLKDLETAH